MSVIKGLVTSDGALVRISVGWCLARAKKLRLARNPVPVPVDATALVDIGAEVTCLDSKLVNDLGLPFASAALANVPALPNITFALEYDASLTILHPSGVPRQNLVFPDLAVLELPLNTIGYQAIIGRDVLAQCLLVYNGPRQRFALKY